MLEAKHPALKEIANAEDALDSMDEFMGAISDGADENTVSGDTVAVAMRCFVVKAERDREQVLSRSLAAARSLTFAECAEAYVQPRAPSSL